MEARDRTDLPWLLNREARVAGIHQELGSCPLPLAEVHLAAAVVAAGWLCTSAVASVGVGSWAGPYPAGPVAAVVAAAAAEVDFPASFPVGSSLPTR